MEQKQSGEVLFQAGWAFRSFDVCGAFFGYVRDHVQCGFMCMTNTIPDL